MTPGTFLFDPEFKFSDDEIGQKILVVLNDGSVGHYIVVKTTSNNKFKNSNSGCQLRDRYPNFFLPKEVCCLKEHTWIQLQEFFEFQCSELIDKHFNRGMKTIGNLSQELIQELLRCAVRCDDITQNQEKILIETLQSLSVVTN